MMIRWRIALVLVCGLVLPGLAGPLATTAQAGVTVYLEPVDARTGESIFDGCFVLQNFSNEGCDENGDGRISYEGVPAGDYLVVQTVDAEGYETLDPVEITVRDSPDEQSFEIELEPIGDVQQPSGDDGGVTVRFQTIDASDSSAITEVCYILVDASLEGCDSNGDGLIGFADVPPGVYTVQQTQGAAGYLPVGDFPIIVNVHDAEQVWGVEMARRRFNVDSANISVVPFDVNTAEALPGACVILHGGSIEGCDENGDGRIGFEDVVTGSYLLSQTAAPSGYHPTYDRWVHVQGNGQIFLEQWPNESGDPTIGETAVDVALVTRHPETGELLTGACYIILDASIEGCDENEDGQVDFEDVSPGTYEVTQTNAPDGFDEIDDFTIQINNFDPGQSMLIVQREEQYEPGFRNVSVVIFDWDTDERITSDNACAVLVDFSNEGCDLNEDGQVDFQDIPVGEYVVEVTGLPDGYEPYFDEDFLFVDDENPLSIVTIYVPVVRE